MMTQSIDKKNKISVDAIIKAEGLTEEQLQELWVEIFDYIVNKLVEAKNEQD